MPDFTIKFHRSEEELLPQVSLALPQPIATLPFYALKENKFHRKNSVFVRFVFS